MSLVDRPVNEQTSAFESQKLERPPPAGFNIRGPYVALSRSAGDRGTNGVSRRSPPDLFRHCPSNWRSWRSPCHCRLPSLSGVTEADRMRPLTRCLDRTENPGVGATLRKGPRGGGCDLAKIVEHVYGPDHAYLSAIGGHYQKFGDDDMARLRNAIVERLAATVRGELRRSDRAEWSRPSPVASGRVVAATGRMICHQPSQREDETQGHKHRCSVHVCLRVSTLPVPTCAWLLPLPGRHGRLSATRMLSDEERPPVAIRPRVRRLPPADPTKSVTHDDSRPWLPLGPL